MGWSAGVFTRTKNWFTDAAAKIKILASRHDENDDELTAGINQCVNKDGSNAATGNLNLGGFRYTNGADATGAADLTTAQQIQSGGLVYAADTGVADAYAIALTPTETGYATGQIFRFKAVNANTGASTLNVDSLGAKTIKKHNDQDLAAGDIEAGAIVSVIYDGTNLQMISQVGNLAASAGDVQNSTLTYKADTGAADAYAIAPTPAITAYVAGQLFHFNAVNANTGASTLDVSSLGVKTIKKNHDQDLVAGDIEAGSVVSVIYDGTNFQMVSQLGNTNNASITLTDSAPTTPVAKTLYEDSIVKVWAHVDQTPVGQTLVDDVNVSSVTDSGVGQSGINFATNMGNATYSAVGGGGNGARYVDFNGFATTAINMNGKNASGTGTDLETALVTIVGNN